MLQKILKRLISFHSLSGDHEANARLLDFAEDILGQHLFVRRFSSNGHPSLVATVRRTKKPKMLLVGHTDVVPGPEKLFRLQMRGGKLFGRGVLDMKFAIACYLRLVQELGSDIKKYDLGVILTSDEEIGGFNGVEYLLKKGYGAEFAFLPDGGINWQIERGSKGMWHVDFEVHGKTAHAAHPWEGESAIMTFFRFLQELEKEFAPNLPCDGRHYHDTLTITRIAGGETPNQVPGYLSASVNIRYVPETTKKELEQRILRAAKKFPAISFKERVHGHAWVTNLAHPVIREYIAAAQKQGVDVGDTFSHGSSDARFFAERGIPVLTVWPRGGGHHSDEEWIEKQDFEKYYRILKELITGVAKR